MNGFKFTLVSDYWCLGKDGHSQLVRFVNALQNQ